jgi:hypothetical protein
LTLRSVTSILSVEAKYEEKSLQKGYAHEAEAHAQILHPPADRSGLEASYDEEASSIAARFNFSNREV